MKEHMKYLNDIRCIAIVCILSVLVFLSGCARIESQNENEQQNIVIQELEEDLSDAVNDEEQNIADETDGLYDFEVEQKEFVFLIDEEKYSIPYIQVQKCPDEALQWRINHTLLEEACWIFDCAELGDVLYGIYEYDNPTIEIAELYRYDKYLSVVYKSKAVNIMSPSRVVYAIVVDMSTGERVLLSDIIKNESAFKEKLLHYFDGVSNEIGLFISENKAEAIVKYGGMTEAEIIIYNQTFGGKRPEYNNGEVGGIDYLFEASSFYITEYGLVVLPGATCFEPLYYDWNEIGDVITIADIDEEKSDSLKETEKTTEQYTEELLYGIWRIEEVALRSEGYDNISLEETASEYEEFIGCELEYSKEYFRFNNQKYNNPKYVTDSVTFKEYNINRGFEMPGLYGLVTDREIELFGNPNVGCLSNVKLPSYDIMLEKDGSYNKWNVIPGINVCMLNEETILIKYINITSIDMIACRVNEGQ